MATAKAERLLNLVIALVNAPRFRTAAWIRERVAGYVDATSDEAFSRMFERDKTELRDLGIALITDGNDGYRIPPADFALPELSFTAPEKAAIGLAGRLWQTTALGVAGSGAVRKIEDAGRRTAPRRGQGQTEQRQMEPAQSGDGRAIGLLQPRVRTGDPSFPDLFAAIRDRRAVNFDYRKPEGAEAETRSVQPWGLVSFRGRWYLVGFDRYRNARRTFRLSRIAGPVTTSGRAGGYDVPADLDLLATVVESVDVPIDRYATLKVRSQRAAGLRRMATDTVKIDADWDRLQVPIRHLRDTARLIAATAEDAIVEAPEDLRAIVIGLLQDVAARAG